MELKKQIINGDIILEEKRRREWDERQRRLKHEADLKDKAGTLAAGAAAAAASVVAAGSNTGGRFWSLPFDSAIAHITGNPIEPSDTVSLPLAEHDPASSRIPSDDSGVQESKASSEIVSAAASGTTGKASARNWTMGVKYTCPVMLWKIISLGCALLVTSPMVPRMSRVSPDRVARLSRGRECHSAFHLRVPTR